MYCSSCGVVVSHGLAYCNYCGAKLAGKEESAAEPRDVRPGFVLFAMMATFIFGLLAITLLMGMMKSVLNLDVGQILAFIFLSFLIMLGLEGVYVWMLLRRRHRTAASEKVGLKNQVTNELDAARERFLPAPSSSVTENTTRAFARVKDKDEGW
jgi:ABC-type multidrug transport system fused ATPase/permease subunit